MPELKFPLSKDHIQVLTQCMSLLTFAFPKKRKVLKPSGGEIYYVARIGCQSVRAT